MNAARSAGLDLGGPLLLKGTPITTEASLQITSQRRRERAERVARLGRAAGLGCFGAGVVCGTSGRDMGSEGEGFGERGTSRMGWIQAGHCC